MVEFLEEASKVTNLTRDGARSAKAARARTEWAFDCDTADAGFRRLPWREGLCNVPIPRWYRVTALWCRQFAMTTPFQSSIDGTILMMQCMLFINVTDRNEPPTVAHSCPGSDETSCPFRLSAKTSFGKGIVGVALQPLPDAGQPS